MFCRPRLPGSCGFHLQRAALQNPGKLKREEETVRLERSLKKLRRDLTEKKKASEEQDGQVAKLQVDLDNIKSCEQLLFRISSGRLAQQMQLLRKLVKFTGSQSMLTLLDVRVSARK